MRPYGRDEYELPSLDFLGDERALRAEALEELRAAGGRDYRAPEYQEAGDSTNSVRVTVDRSGLVKDVHIRTDWHTRLTLDRLGPALLEAQQNARTALMNAVALASLAEEERNPDEGYRRHEPEPVEPAPEVSIAEIWRQLSDVEDLMYRTDKLTRERGRHENIRTIYSPYRLLSGECEGSTLISIKAEPTLAREIGAEQLRSEALELFRRAQGTDG